MSKALHHRKLKYYSIKSTVAQCYKIKQAICAIKTETSFLFNLGKKCFKLWSEWFEINSDIPIISVRGITPIDLNSTVRV